MEKCPDCGKQFKSPQALAATVGGRIHAKELRLYEKRPGSGYRSHDAARSSLKRHPRGQRSPFGWGIAT